MDFDSRTNNKDIITRQFKMLMNGGGVDYEVDTFSPIIGACHSSFHFTHS